MIKGNVKPVRIGTHYQEAMISALNKMKVNNQQILQTQI